MKLPLRIYGLDPAELVLVFFLLAAMTNTIFKNRTRIRVNFSRYAKNWFRTPKITHSKQPSKMRPYDHQRMETQRTKRPHYLPVLGEGFIRWEF